MPGIDFSPVRNWLAYWHPMQLSVTRRCLLCDISQDALECQCLPEKQFKGWIKVVSHSCPCIRPCALILGGGVILMEEIQHQLIGSLSHHYLQGFYIPSGAGFQPSTAVSWVPLDSVTPVFWEAQGHYLPERLELHQAEVLSDNHHMVLRLN